MTDLLFLGLAIATFLILAACTVGFERLLKGVDDE